MIISGRQIRGARGLLGWSMEDLADKTGITRITVRQIEAETVHPQERTLASILGAFDREGIEFQDNEGVCFRRHEMRVYSGKSGYRQLLDHIYETLKNGGRIRQFNFDEANYMPTTDNYAIEHIRRMEEIEGLDARVLAQAGSIDNPVSYCSYRTLDVAYKDLAPWYIYGDTMLLPLNESGRREFSSIHSKPMVERYIRAFNSFWNKVDKKPKKLKTPK